LGLLEFLADFLEFIRRVWSNRLGHWFGSLRLVATRLVRSRI
jgi:hypothetical protein